MNKICYVDKNIFLQEEQSKKLRELNFDVKYTNFQDKNICVDEYEYILLHSFLSNEILKGLMKCKYIGIRAHNTDYVNKEIASEKGIYVKGLKNQYGINAVAEHTFMLIFSLAKNIVTTHNNTISGRWRDGLQLNLELRDKIVGIVGHGKIGKRVAEMAEAFGMKVLIAGKKDNLKEGQLPIDEVLELADIVSLHIPATKENEKYIDREMLRKMRKDSILINTARGAVLDHAALEDEIKSGRFLGVGLDVYEEEPAIKSSLFDYSNVICTPHNAYLTKESLNKMNEELIENFKNFINIV